MFKVLRGTFSSFTAPTITQDNQPLFVATDCSCNTFAALNHPIPQQKLLSILTKFRIKGNKRTTIINHGEQKLICWYKYFPTYSRNPQDFIDPESSIPY
jgi:hypothetical protein